jgi:hypothetical protein
VLCVSRTTLSQNLREAQLLLYGDTEIDVPERQTTNSQTLHHDKNIDCLNIAALRRINAVNLEPIRLEPIDGALVHSIACYSPLTTGRQSVRGPSFYPEGPTRDEWRKIIW